jgi:hypothetical protein
MARTAGNTRPGQGLPRLCSSGMLGMQDPITSQHSWEREGRLALAYLGSLQVSEMGFASLRSANDGHALVGVHGGFLPPLARNAWRGFPATEKLKPA